jgi:hypothetical protein
VSTRKPRRSATQSTTRALHSAGFERKGGKGWMPTEKGIPLPLMTAFSLSFSVSFAYRIAGSEVRKRDACRLSGAAVVSFQELDC